MAAVHDFIRASTGLRQDGRRAHEIRRIAVLYDTMSDGDVYGFNTQTTPGLWPMEPDYDALCTIKHGLTTVTALVHGPIEKTRRQKTKQKTPEEKCSIDVTCNVQPFANSERKINAPITLANEGANERRSIEAAMIVRKTLEACILTQHYPLSAINLTIHVLFNDGGWLSAAINAATMACIQAGIPMREPVWATSIGFADTTAIVDVCLAERGQQRPEITIALGANTKTVYTLQLDHSNRMPIDQLDNVLTLATQAIDALHISFRKSLKAYTEELVKSKGIV